MSVVLYKKNGAKLEYKLSEPDKFRHEIKFSGWKLTKEECFQKEIENGMFRQREIKRKQKSEEKINKEETCKEIQVTDLNEMSDKEIRMLGKKYKIRSYHNKRIEKLKHELKKCLH